MAKSTQSNQDVKPLLRTIAAASADAQVTGLFPSTHPPTTERLQLLEQILEQGFSVPSPPSNDELSSVQARLQKR